jgi:hypothetical protein
MAYYTGTASSMADLLTALTTAAVANGWTWADSILFSGSCYVKLTAAADKIEALVGLGKSGTDITTPAPASTYLSAVLSQHPIVFPLVYHVFARGDEVYCLINFSTSYYSVLGFGQSPVDGAPGTGVWVAGTAYTSYAGGGGLVWSADGTIAGGNFSAGNNSARSGLFIVSGGEGGGTGAGCYVHHGLPGWSGLAVDMPKTQGGIKQLNALDNPSVSWNAQTMLVPIQPHIDRGSNKVSLVADLQHARYVRLDNLEPGDTITLGPDEWKVFPVYRKDASARDGGGTHSGTYGYAFRV